MEIFEDGEIDLGGVIHALPDRTGGRGSIRASSWKWIMEDSRCFYERLDKVSHAVVAQPLMVGGIGLLSVIISVDLFLTVISLVALVFAWLFGTVATGKEVGERLARTLRQNGAVVVSAGLGTFLLMFVIGSIQAMNNFS